jgi:hypothetical protein
MIIIIEIIEHHNVVEVVVDRKKFQVVINIDEDQDQDPDIDHQNIIVHRVHVHVIVDIINVLVHGKYQDLK